MARLSKLEDTPLRNASWIWLNGPSPGADEYVCFRRRFQAMPTETKAFLDFSADTDFVAYLNGIEVGRQQFSDFADRKTWSRFFLDGVLVEGENLLAILVFHRGEDFFDYEAGRPGLIACVGWGEDSLISDARCRAALHPAFKSGRRERLTLQTGFTFEYDARLQEEWTVPSYDDRRWEFAAVVQESAEGDQWKSLTPRPLSACTMGQLPPVRIVSQGSFLRTTQGPCPAAVEMEGAALRTEYPWDVFGNPEFRPSFPVFSESSGGAVAQPANAYQGSPTNPGTLLNVPGAALAVRSPAPGMDGRYFIIDLGAETVGLLEFEVEAPAGTVLLIAHGEHLDNGRVRAKISIRNFADRYICKEGWTSFQMPFRRLAGRYLEIHSTHEISLRSFGLRPVEYIPARRSAFQVPDTRQTRLHQVAIRTLELCRHEHFEDCPWREQALYGYDSRLQALYGYLAFGDYRFAEVSLSLLGQTLSSDGFLALTAPGRCDITIPIFTFAWVAAVAEHWLYSGKPTLYRAMSGVIDRIMEYAFSRFDAETGLYGLPRGDRYWHFYEWTPGLTGEGASAPGGTPHIAYNLHLHEAARAYAWMLSHSGKPAQRLERRLRALRETIHREFWRSADFYGTVPTSEVEPSSGEVAFELVQALALHEGIVPPKQRGRLFETLASGKLQSCSLSALVYLAKPMLAQSPKSRAWISGRLELLWEKMIASGATSLWETKAAGDDFDFAGSLCHGWSALPVWYHASAILGIHPLSPGFRQFIIQPYPSRFPEASGTVPTPFGQLSIRWVRTSEGLRIEAKGPKQCQPILAPLPEATVAEARYNGTPLASISKTR